MTGYIQVITTIDSEEMAEEITKHLLKKRVASCVQILPISSSYWWKGKIEKSKEYLCLIKGKNFNKIEKAIKEVHPYVIPEILELPITRGNVDYLNWINKETK